MNNHEDITNIEKELNLKINIEALAKNAKHYAEDEIDFDSQISKNSVLFFVDDEYIGKNVEVYLDDDYLLTANIGKKAKIKIHAKNKIGKMLAEAIRHDGNIRLILV